MEYWALDWMTFLTFDLCDGDFRTSCCGQRRGCTRRHVGVSTENTL